MIAEVGVAMLDHYASHADSPSSMQQGIVKTLESDKKSEILRSVFVVQSSVSWVMPLLKLVYYIYTEFSFDVYWAYIELWCFSYLLSPCLVVGAEFITYMEAFKPYLIEALRNRAEHQVIKNWQLKWRTRLMQW